jgi:nitrogen fixation/metabolism regulation signal transduction histidine kinase
VSLRTKFFIYLVFVHIVFAAAAVYFLRHMQAWFLAVEAFFSISLIFGAMLIRKMFEPIRLIRSGVEFIKANEFATRFREVGQPDLDPLIRVYNQMADGLREQRIHNEEQEMFLQRIVAASPSGILALDMDGRVSMANESAGRLLQRPRDDLLGRRLNELGTRFADTLGALGQDQSMLVPLQGARRVRCQALHFMDRGFARRFILLDELTDELHKSEKAAYEKVIRMMSHEINNTSGAVNSLLESCLNYGEQISTEDRDDFARALSAAISRSDRLNVFMREFAEVVRLPAPNHRPTAVPDLLHDVAFAMERESKRRRVAWSWHVEDAFPLVEFDPTQMERVFINIFKNALEAIGEDGTITVTLGASNARPFAAVGDTGPGIPPGVMDQLFTPFFSSKRDGRGIGLTLVREVLVRHGFDFELANREPHGAEFTIHFGA